MKWIIAFVALTLGFYGLFVLMGDVQFETKVHIGIIVAAVIVVISAQGTT